MRLVYTITILEEMKTAIAHHHWYDIYTDYKDSWHLHNSEQFSVFLSFSVSDKEYLISSGFNKWCVP